MYFTDYTALMALVKTTWQHERKWKQRLALGIELTVTAPLFGPVETNRVNSDARL